jgi:hypothetical protein
MLTDSQFSFPDGLPTVDGSAVVLGPANVAKGVLLEVEYPLGGNWPIGSILRAAVSWELVRLACDGINGCNNAGGPAGVDHDPIFIIRQDDEAYAWQVADNLKGSYHAGAFNVNGPVGGPWLNNVAKYTNTNFFPEIGQRYNVDISYTFYSDRVDSTMNVVLAGRPDIISIPHSFNYFGAFDPLQPFSLGIMNEDNRGELYKLVGASVALPPVPEPSTLLLFSVGALALTRRIRAA